MRIATINVPEGCKEIFVDLEEGALMVTYGSTINQKEVYNQYTRQLEEVPGIGDFSIFRKYGRRNAAVIGLLEGKESGRYKANDKILYDYAIKFRDYEQYLKINGMYAEKDEP